MQEKELGKCDKCDKASCTLSTSPFHNWEYCEEHYKEHIRSHKGFLEYINS